MVGRFKKKRKKPLKRDGDERKKWGRSSTASTRNVIDDKDEWPQFFRQQSLIPQTIFKKMRYYLLLFQVVFHEEETTLGVDNYELSGDRDVSKLTS